MSRYPVRMVESRKQLALNADEDKGKGNPWENDEKAKSSPTIKYKYSTLLHTPKGPDILHKYSTPLHVPKTPDILYKYTTPLRTPKGPIFYLSIPIPLHTPQRPDIPLQRHVLLPLC